MTLAVLVSGGVDSSVALCRLADEGHELTAFYLKVWLEDEMASLGRCPWEEDLRYVRAVCTAAGVPLEVRSLQREYHHRVVSYILAQLEAGRTPSPDLLCNQQIKFGAFVDHLEPRFERIASGHYARLRPRRGSLELHKGVDPVKDQSYFLALLTQQQLRRCLFPLGELTKTEVRRLAEEYALPNRNRPESQGLCFLGDVRFRDFVAAHLGHRQGDIREATTCRLLGQHRGHWFYTIGQRTGLGLSGGPWYVVRKDPLRNQVWVAHRSLAADLPADRFAVRRPHWIGAPPAKVRLEVKLRHGPTVGRCSVEAMPDDRWEVRLEERDRGIAPGQFAVFYDGTCCLGAGVIEPPGPA